MNAEYQAFLQILKSYIDGNKMKTFPENINWETIIKLAESHNLTGIVYIQCREYLSGKKYLSSIFQRLQKGFMWDVFYSQEKRKDFERLEAAFTAEKIPFLAFKGIVLKDYHPAPELRTMGDVDILIHPEDRRKSRRIMMELGFEEKGESGSAVLTYDYDMAHYEIHDRMIYEPLANQVDYESYFNKAWDHARPVKGSSRYELDESFHFLYLIAHTAKHIVNKGCGFRPYLDMIFLARGAGERMDWNWICGQLEELGLMEFAKVCSAECKNWFDIELPVSGKKLKDSDYQEMTEKVLSDGIFGHRNAENNIAAWGKLYHRSGKPYWRVALSVVKNSLFPSYEDMRTVSQYSFVDHRPWILPAAWVYRYCYCMLNKFGSGVKRLSEPYRRKKEIKDRDEKIRKLGL